MSYVFIYYYIQCHLHNIFLKLYQSFVSKNWTVAALSKGEGVSDRVEVMEGNVACPENMHTEYLFWFILPVYIKFIFMLSVCFEYMHVMCVYWMICSMNEESIVTMQNRNAYC